MIKDNTEDNPNLKGGLELPIQFPYENKRPIIIATITEIIVFKLVILKFILFHRRLSFYSYL